MSFRRQNQPGPGGRKTSNGTSGSMASSVTGSNSNRPTPGRNRNSVKIPSQSPPVFEGVYNNSRMLHFLTAVVGSRCDVMVKNGSVYEGIFKTLSSRCELAVDAVHKVKNEEGDGGGGGGTPVHPRREEITDTMIFGPSDLVTMICRDVDLNYAIRDTFTDSAIGSTRINGDHREKVLQRWDGGDSNGENFDLDADASNGWDASEMFRFNEETYGVKSTYDSSLAMYTVPLERGSSEGFRQREARAARLANEIEASSQYRHRVALENDDGRTEEDKFSAVVRDRDRDGGERERGRDSPGFSNRESKYIPLPQRAREREMGVSVRGERGGAVSTLPNRTNRPGPPSSSPRPLPSGSGQPIPPTDRSSPLSVRGGYSTHQSQSSSPTQPGHSSPPSPHTLPHSLSHPQSLSDSARPVNGVSSRMSPKSQRPGQNNRNLRTSNSHSSPTVSRSPKPDAPSQDSPLATPTYVDTSSITMVSPKPTGPTPLFPVDVNEILSKERTESPVSPQDGKSGKVSTVQQRSQDLEELRKFGTDFRLRSSSSHSNPKTLATDSSQTNPAHNTQADSTPSTDAKAAPPTSLTAELPAEERSRETNAEGVATTTPPPATPISALSGTAMQNPTAERQTAGTPQPGTPGSEEGKPEGAERSEGMTDQVKKSTLNPNAKEFNPTKAPLSMVKPSAAPTPPRPTPPSPTVVLQPPPNQGAIYNTQYLSYVSPIQIQGHSVQAPQMYPYAMTNVGQGKYPRAKGSVVTSRPDHSSSAPPMLQAAASAAGPPLVASPYPPSYLQYNQVISAMPHYPGQMYSMLQGGPRMLGSGGHPQTLGPPGPQYPGQTEGPPAPQQGMYAPQSFSHHSGSLHHPQPSSTPTGSQPPQHPAPSPGQSGQSGPQPQSLYHSGPLSAPTPPNMPPGHSSPQAPYSLQGYSLSGHQPMPHPYSSLGPLTQAHVQGALSGPHHSGGHGPQPVMLLHAPPPQQGSGPQHGPPPPQQGPHQHYTYVGHPQVSVQPHPTQQIPYHPPGN
ncbi:ataxin-2-like protein isoform X1 [Pimephales promelas]|uniref:ataxin-2-like protein isoform X1 n=1 Tax=Pimephales promelas TaxID=90988 RepID=UPI001955917B|nr:ataxin-2-like protein isoform X1 [Pimephales promelas]KAG1967593.1 ataxin-2-like protein [Pimephales promelas]